MSELLFWLYLSNSVLIINHEIDSAYWKEWELFKLPGGINGFLLIHLPLLLFILYGLVLVTRRSFTGLIFSLILCLGGFFAFMIHTYFLKKGEYVKAKELSEEIISNICRTGGGCWDPPELIGTSYPTYFGLFGLKVYTSVVDTNIRKIKKNIKDEMHFIELLEKERNFKTKITN